MTTLAHYLDLLSGAGLVTGLQKYSGSRIRQRGSSPKLLVLNTALMNAMSGLTFAATREDRDRWGRVVETAVGAHLAKPAQHRELWYWREGQHEADFIVRVPRATFAIEVKSGRRRESASGLAAFKRAYPRARPLIVGADGVAVEDFLAREGQLEQLAG